MPRIAVVICHHNRPGVLGPLLDSLRAQTAAGELAIFLVDNGSTDGSAAEAVAYPEVTVLATGANRGGTGGFNFGLAEVQRRGGWDAVLLLDNDVTLAPGAVAAMQEVLDTRPRAGMVTGTVYFAHERELIQETGALLIPATGDLLPRFHRRYDDGSYVDTVAVDYAGACLLMVRGATLAQIGLMDDSYFLYWDDIDWCCRARAAGWDVIAAPAAKCWHRGGLNVRRTTGYHYYKLRNRLRFWKRWATAEEWPGIVAAIGREVATMRAVAAWQQRPALAATLPPLKLEWDEKMIWNSPAVKFAPELIACVDHGVDKAGYSKRRMVSGAGHDAVYIARVAPTTMIFVPCEGGLSHNEYETIRPEEAAAGAQVLLNAVLEYDATLA